MTRLRLRNIRLYGEAAVSLPEGISVLSGANGAGKTTVVECVHVLACLHSFRTTALRELIRTGEELGAIEGEFGSTARRVVLEPGKRTLLRDGKGASAARFCQDLAVVALAPEHREILFGGSKERRRFLDRLTAALRPEAHASASRYQRALEQKQSLLGKELPYAVYADQVLPWDEELAREGEEIRSRRAALVRELLPRASRWLERIAPGQGEMTLGYAASPEGMREELAAKRALEHAAKRALVGPHRDDLLLAFRGAPAGEVASHGEAASLLLALKLAELELVEESGASPILILDDVGATLDRARRERLFEKLSDGKRQAVFTTADEEIARAAVSLGGRIVRREPATMAGPGAVSLWKPAPFLVA